MALVNYSDSDSGEEPTKTELDGKAAGPSTLKRKHDQCSTSDLSSDLPPLPAAFHDLYASTSRVSTRDDPSLHGGRKRVVPHVEGNWATHVYLEWYPTATESDHLSSLISTLQDSSSEEESQFQSLLTSDLGAQLPLHISLSRPIVLQTEQRQTFTEQLQEQIRKSGVRLFEISFTGIEWVSNYESTRWFLVLRLSKPATNALNRLLHISNQVAASFGQSTLYADPNPGPEPPARGRGSGRGRGFRGRHDTRFTRGERRVKPLIADCSPHFHISIAWTLQAPSPTLLERTQAPEVARSVQKEIRDLALRFDSVKLKLGNTVTVIALPTRAEEGKGLLGI
ncbi:MAG: poly(U)-specific 3'-to-5' RNA exonuclease [Candelina mexicana]|nr:MAG: poly(U)-specific 3'-to-5' RNA exonuclease [Candelina mexicana]